MVFVFTRCFVLRDICIFCRHVLICVFYNNISETLPISWKSQEVQKFQSIAANGALLRSLQEVPKKIILILGPKRSILLNFYP
jgi:hypothetical protein